MNRYVIRRERLGRYPLAERAVLFRPVTAPEEQRDRFPAVLRPGSQHPIGQAKKKRSLPGSRVAENESQPWPVRQLRQEVLAARRLRPGQTRVQIALARMTGHINQLHRWIDFRLLHA